MHDKEILKFVFKSDKMNDEIELFYNKNDYYFGGDSGKRFKTFKDAIQYIRCEFSLGSDLKIDSVFSEFTTFTHI
tara:strand:- start:29 stop:253 length:225 start_codon:yes stop_codon:yes gene_type:complete